MKRSKPSHGDITVSAWILLMPFIVPVRDLLVRFFCPTDDSLIKSLKSHEAKITTRAHNPVQWLMEVTKDGSEDIA